MKLSAQFDYSQVDHQKDNTVHLLLSVEAPAIDWVAQRSRICVLPVVDVSGSMSGAKLDYAKQACKKLVEQLKVGDYCGLITFESAVRVVVKPAEVTPEFKTQLLSAIEQLKDEGGTNFSGAITRSLDELTRLDLPPSIVQRAIFFTDGQPTNGVTDPEVVKNLVSSSVGSHSMSFFGYGEGAGCDQGFLKILSDRGKGNYAYVQSPDDALAAFGRELGGLLSTYASDLRLTLEPRNGHAIEKVVTVLGPDKQLGAGSDPTEVSLELGDILAEETRHVVVEFSVKKQDKALPREFNVVNVKATWRRIAAAGDKTPEEASATGRIRFVRPEDAQKTPIPEVDRIVALHQLVIAQQEAEAEAAKGQFHQAQVRLDLFAQQANTRGYAGIGDMATSLGARVASPAQFFSMESQSYRGTVGKGLLRGMSVSSFNQEAEQHLNVAYGGGGPGGALMGTMTTSALDAYEAAFVSSPEAPAVAQPTPSNHPLSPTHFAAEVDPQLLVPPTSPSSEAVEEPQRGAPVEATSQGG